MIWEGQPALRMIADQRIRDYRSREREWGALYSQAPAEEQNRGEAEEEEQEGAFCIMSYWEQQVWRSECEISTRAVC